MSAEEGRQEIEANFLPPVSQGDVLALCRKRPLAIGIIDGFFDRVPAVWHKEILWAMSHGIHVFGAASIGALRAAELHRFGMTGVGKIFEAYLSGDLEDDDEVAVIHGPEETGYVLASEPMVNIRHTLAAAESRGIIGRETRCHLVGIAKQLYYAERQYPTVLDLGFARSVNRKELEALSAWLPVGRIDQKRADAVALLRHLRAWRDSQPKPMRVAFHFQHTEAWSNILQAVGGQDRSDRAEFSVSDSNAILAELRLKGPLYHREHERAMVRALCLKLARAQGLHAADQMVREAAVEFCLNQGLLVADDMEEWLASQGLDGADFDQLLRDEARIRRVRVLTELDLEGDLLDHLRMTGQYGVFARRAHEKQRVLTLNGLEMPSLSDTGLTETGLWRWYFEGVLEVATPEDIVGYAKSLDFENQERFRLAVLREFCYQRLLAEPHVQENRVS